MADVHAIRLLQASTDAEDKSEFRILIDNPHIKYVSTDQGIFDEINMVFEPTLIELLLPLLPPGDWNHAHIFQDGTSSVPAEQGARPTVKVSKKALPSIKRTWHPVKIDYLDFQIGACLRSNVYEATHPTFPHPVVIKFARFTWEISWLDAETAAYEWIDGHDIGPEFLGHLTEHGRVIGFIMSRVEGARHATLDDFEPCRKALEALHALRIKHGDINKHNLLVHSGGVILIDFDGAVQNATTEELRDELESLEGHLRDTSGRGGIVTKQT